MENKEKKRKLTQLPYNTVTGKEYQGSNVIVLLSSSDCKEWGTFLQWRDSGYKVIKGSKGTGIRTFINSTKRNRITGKIEETLSPRHYTVFNREQVEKQKCNGKHKDVESIVKCSECREEIDSLQASTE